MKQGNALPVVQIVVFEGFDELDVFGPFEPLAAAGFDVRLVSAAEPGEVRSQHGIRLVLEEQLSAAGGIVVPGGGWLDRARWGVWAEVERGELVSTLSTLSPKIPFIASVCSGAMLLGHAGLLTEVVATTNPACFEDLAPMVKELRSERVVDAGHVITAGAPSCGLDLGIHLVGRFCGEDAASEIARRLDMPR